MNLLYSQSMNESYPRIPIIDRMTLVLNEILRNPSGFTSAELLKKLNIPKTTLYRLLNSMQENGYLRYNSESGVFIPGNRFTYAYYSLISNHEKLKKIGLQVLKEISSITEETSKISVLYRSSAMTLCESEGTKTLRIILEENSIFPLHSSAAGKVLMTTFGQSELEHYFKEHLCKYTDTTINSPDNLLNELRSIKSNGFAIDNGEYSSDVGAISVPLYDEHLNIIAAIGIAYPQVNKRNINKEKIIALLQEKSKTITNKIVSSQSSKSIVTIGK